MWFLGFCSLQGIIFKWAPSLEEDPPMVSRLQLVKSIPRTEFEHPRDIHGEAFATSGLECPPNSLLTQWDFEHPLLSQLESLINWTSN